MFLGFALAAVLGAAIAGTPPPAVVVPPPTGTVTRTIMLPTPPPKRRKLRAPAVKPTLANTQEIFNEDNYPFWAMTNVEEGTVRAEVDVTPEGTATNCWVTRSSGFVSLDLGTCGILTRQGRFNPGRDKKGRPVESRWVGNITWQLAQDKFWTVEDLQTLVVFSVGPEGDIRGCRMEQYPNQGEYDPRSCGELTDLARLIVATAPSDLDWINWEIVLETRDFAGAGDGALLVGKRAGEILFDRGLTRLTIDPAGRIKRCDLVESSRNPEFDKAAWCDRMIRTTYFEPAKGPEDRLLTGVEALYLRRKPVIPDIRS